MVLLVNAVMAQPLRDRRTKVSIDIGNGEEDTSNSTKVVIYTFYSRIERTSKAEGNHEAILENWKNSWRDMGWEPRLLTMKDAKKHPNYKNFKNVLDRLPLDGKSGAVGEYNKMCYYRWLAMSNVGGWFADFDTVPLRRPTKQDYEDSIQGKFNVYHRFHVPALVSGSKEEWNRMTSLLIESGLNFLNHVSDSDDYKLWSDMVALQYVVANDLCDCNVHNKVAEGRFFLDGKPVQPRECWSYRKDIAAHFSHDAMKFGVLPDGYGVKSRDVIIKDWFETYKQKCGIQ